jgi:hypothetical protein
LSANPTCKSAIFAEKCTIKLIKPICSTDHQHSIRRLFMTRDPMIGARRKGLDEKALLTWTPSISLRIVPRTRSSTPPPPLDPKDRFPTIASISSYECTNTWSRRYVRKSRCGS